MNKYLISVDIEGITGVINRDFANKDGKYHQLGCDYMTSDVNAVVQVFLMLMPMRGLWCGMRMGIRLILI